jgi:hypothetical protein
MLSTSLPAQEGIISAFQIKWQNSKGYLMEIAEAMPAEYYSYSPTPRQMSFADQLLHIRDNMLWLVATILLRRK